MKTVFVTVGTTEFDELVKSVVQADVLEALHAKGYRKVSIQKGKGSFIPQEGMINGITVEVFRYKENLIADFNEADFVISHAGAGSCFEALEMGKPLIAVINKSLMNNHQLELAEALAHEGFCKWCYPSDLLTTVKELHIDELSLYQKGQPDKLITYIDSVFKLKNA